MQDKNEADRDTIEKLLKNKGRVYGEALRRLAEGKPSIHEGMWGE